jgi:hypothetical protein
MKFFFFSLIFADAKNASLLLIPLRSGDVNREGLGRMLILPSRLIFQKEKSD